jgi:hypothetical protein
MSTTRYQHVPLTFLALGALSSSPSSRSSSSFVARLIWPPLPAHQWGFVLFPTHPIRLPSLAHSRLVPHSPPPAGDLRGGFSS